jgi:hypothetical protein
MGHSGNDYLIRPDASPTPRFASRRRCRTIATAAILSEPDVRRSGHGFRFAQDPFYSNGYCPVKTTRQAVTGDWKRSTRQSIL